MRGTWDKHTDPKPRIRHLAYTHSTGDGFGDHYVTYDKSLPTAEQFDVTVYPRGDNRRPAGDPFRETPHVVTRVFDGTEWTETGIAPIGK